MISWLELVPGDIAVAYISIAHLDIHAHLPRKLQFQLEPVRDCDGCNFGRFDYLEALMRLGKPILHTFHHPITQSLVDAVERQQRSARVLFHCISEHQYAQAEFNSPSVVIPNPIDLNLYQKGDGTGGYLAFLGRLTEIRGDIALRSAPAGKRCFWVVSSQRTWS